MADSLPPPRIRVDAAPSQATPQPAFQGKDSFTQKLIEITVQLAPDPKTGQPIKFAGTGSDTLTLSGFRTSVRIDNSGAPAGSNCHVVVYGMNPNVMNQLSTLGQIFNSVQRNSISISAGDTGGLSPVYSGTIVWAFPDYSAAPNVGFHFVCQTGQINAVLPVPASSFPQSTDVATIMAGLARQFPCGFENSGVTVQMPPSYFAGTIMDQIRAAAQAAHINAEIVPSSTGQTVLAIWPIGGSRTQLTAIPLVSKATGMILAPSFAPNGFMLLRNLFNPQISFGGRIQVMSDVVPQANRRWVVQRMSLALDSLVPKGKWEQSLLNYPDGYAVPPAPKVSM